MCIFVCMHACVSPSHVPAPFALYGAASTSNPITEPTDLSVNLDSLSHQVCLHCVLMTLLLPEKVSWPPISVHHLSLCLLMSQLQSPRWFEWKEQRKLSRSSQSRWYLKDQMMKVFSGSRKQDFYLRLIQSIQKASVTLKTNHPASTKEIGIFNTRESEKTQICHKKCLIRTTW